MTVSAISGLRKKIATLLVSVLLLPMLHSSTFSAAIYPGEDFNEGAKRIPCEGNRNITVDKDGNPVGDVGVIIHGKCVRFETPIVVVNDRTLLPMRELIEKSVPSSGYIDSVVFVRWFGDYSTACLDAKSNVLCYPSDQNFMYWNGELRALDQGAVIVDGRTRIPFRDLIEKVGGKVLWDGQTRTITLDMTRAYHIWARPEVVCSMMGYTYDKDCDPDRILAGYYTYQTWGSEFIIEQMLNGTLSQPGMTTYVNKFGFQKKGTPLEGPELKWWEATINTGFDVGMAMFTGWLLKNTAPTSSLLKGAKTPAGREMVFSTSAANGKHAQWFWAPRTGMSPHAVKYQTRAAQTASKVESGKLFVREYAWKDIAFDGYYVNSNGFRVFIEAKSDGGYMARMVKIGVADKIEEGLAREMAKQFLTLRGETAVILEWRVETQLLQTHVQNAVNNRVGTVLIETLGQKEGALAIEQFKEMFRLLLIP